MVRNLETEPPVVRWVVCRPVEERVVEDEQATGLKVGLDGLAEPVFRRPASAITASARLGSLVASSGPVLPTMCAVAPGEARKYAVYTNELFRFNYWSNEPV